MSCRPALGPCRPEKSSWPRKISKDPNLKQRQERHNNMFIFLQRQHYDQSCPRAGESLKTLPTWWRKGQAAGRLSSARQRVCHCWVDLCWHRGQRSRGRLLGCWVSPGRPWPRCTRTLSRWSEAPSCHHHLCGNCKVFFTLICLVFNSD